MSIASVKPAYFDHSLVFRLSVEQYHDFVKSRYFGDKEPIELLEGHMVLKMTQNPAHANACYATQVLLAELAPRGWIVRGQLPVTLSDSEPEPDVCFARGDRKSYVSRHPNPGEIGLVVEVAESSLKIDQQDKTRIYATAGIPVYWIVNLVDRRIEVYTSPSGSAYGTVTQYQLGDGVPLTFDGLILGTIPVSELIV